MTAIGAIRPCARGIFAGPAAEAVWGISDPERSSGNLPIFYKAASERQAHVLALSRWVWGASYRSTT